MGRDGQTLVKTDLQPREKSFIRKHSSLRVLARPIAKARHSSPVPWSNLYGVPDTTTPGPRLRPYPGPTRRLGHSIHGRVPNHQPTLVQRDRRGVGDGGEYGLPIRKGAPRGKARKELGDNIFRGGLRSYVVEREISEGFDIKLDVAR